MIKKFLLWLLCRINQQIRSPSTGACASCGTWHGKETDDERLERIFGKDTLNELSERLSAVLRADCDNEIEIPAERLEMLE